MLDTVILTAQETDYRITKPDLFTPNANKLSEYGFVGQKFTNNFKTKEKYYPRLTITPRSKARGFGPRNDLRIEFSACKLIHGNNLKELSVLEMGFVLQTLYQRLLEMGIELRTSPAKLEVSGFDTAKNIFLSEGYFAFQVIKELNKCTLDRRLDLDHKEYREGTGTTLQFYSKAHSFVIYDKLADLKKPHKRSIDKDRNDLQKDLFDEYQKQEIVRFEVRLRTKVKMKQVLAKIDYKTDALLFEDLFNELIWKRVLNLYWQGLIADKNRFLFSKLNTAGLILAKIKENYPTAKEKEILRFLV